MTNPADSLTGEDRDRYEVFLSELYMKAITEFEPVIEQSVNAVLEAHMAVNRAIENLTDFKHELARLGELRDSKPENPILALQEMRTMQDLIQEARDGGFIYFLEAGSYIKIGFSHDPIVRLGQIRQGRGAITPEGLSTKHARLLAVEQGDMDHERRLHQRFAEHRVAGEWFEKSDRLAHYIQSIATPA